MTTRLLVWLALALLFQPVISAQRATAASGGLSVCSVAGPKRVDADGKPLAASHGGHDCCCVGALAPLPPRPAAHVAAFVDEPAAEPVARSSLAAEWLSPLSRGPPRLL